MVRHCAEAMTLERISREVGLNRMALTSGFHRLFGMSVPECLQEVRIERASELLRDGTQSIAQSAGAVGYEHSCIFSTTVIRALFGHSPQKIRVIRC